MRLSETATVTSRAGIARLRAPASALILKIPPVRPCTWTLRKALRPGAARACFGIRCDLKRETSLHIGLIIYGTLDTVSGGYLYDRRIVEGLRQRGVEVEVVSLPRRNYGLALADNRSAALYRMIREKRWDVLVQDELCHPSLLGLNRRLKKTSSLPIVSIVHHLRSCEFRNRWVNAFYREIEKEYLRTVDGFIFNSACTGAAVKGLLGKERPAVVAYPGRDHLSSGVDEAAVAERGGRSGPLQLLFIGNVIPRKGLHVLIEALALLPRDGWRLTVAGDATVDVQYTKKILARMQGSGLGEAVGFAGRVEDSERNTLLAGCDCLVMPSFHEGFGIAYLEAMGFGKPVIASTAGAAPEWIEDCVEGFLVPPGAVELLAGRIAVLIGNRDLLLEMSLAAWRKHAGHPTWADSAAGVYDFIRRTAAGADPASCLQA